MKKIILTLAIVLSTMASLTSCYGSEPENKENRINVHGFNGSKPEYVYYTKEMDDDGTFDHVFIVASFDLESMLNAAVSDPLIIKSLNIPAPNFMAKIEVETRKATLQNHSYRISPIYDDNSFEYLYLTQELNFGTMPYYDDDVFDMVDGRSGEFVVRVDQNGVKSIYLKGTSYFGPLEIYYNGRIRDGRNLVLLMERFENLLEHVGGGGF